MSELHMNNSNESKEWQLLEKMLLSTVTEQRRARRWRVFFKLFVFINIFVMIYLFFTASSQMTISQSGAHTALIDISGVISDDAEASADNITSGLRQAFENKAAKGIILRINSPGGSAVASDTVYSEVKRLQVLYPKKVYAVITDIGASGGYYIAASADEIYANPASIVGSIGVRIGEGFGFEKLIEKLGIERRILTAGEHKALLDPFAPIKQDELLHMKNMLNGVHGQFIERVKQGRGDRLSENKDIFSGLFWNGFDAKKLGLIDGFATAGDIARDKIKQEELVDYTVRQSPAERFFEKVGVVMTRAAISGLGKVEFSALMTP